MAAATTIQGASRLSRRPLSVVPAKPGPIRCDLTLPAAVLDTFRNHIRRGLWVPAFAGTTIDNSWHQHVDTPVPVREKAP